MGWIRKVYSISNPRLRDFSEKEENRLLSIADDYDDIFDKNVTDRLLRYFDKKGWLDLLVGSEKYQQVIFEAYNINATAIRKIFSAARSADRQSGAKISSLQKQMSTGVLMLKDLSACFSNDNRYDCEAMLLNVISAPGKNYQDMWDLWRKNQIKQITNDEVEEFCKQNLLTFFSDYSNEISMDLWGCKIDELNNAQFGYDSNTVKRTLGGLIDSMIDTNTTTQDMVNDHAFAKKRMETLLSDYEKLSEEEFKKANPGYKESYLEKFIDSVGGAEAYKMMLNKCPEWLDYLFTDYTDGIKILESVDTLGDGNLSEEMQVAIDSLKLEYDEEWRGFISKAKEDVLDFVKENGGDEIKKWIVDKYDNAYILSSIADMSGIGDKIEANAKLKTLAHMAKDIDYAYEQAVIKIRDGNFDESDIESAKHLFELSKQTNIDMYKAYRDFYATDAEKRVYANEQLERLRNLNMKSNYSNNISHSFS